MAVAAHHVLLSLAVAALLATGVRVASLAASEGSERVVAAVCFAAAVAVGEALLLGLLALGGSAVALSLAALGSWSLARICLPQPQLPVTVEIARNWSGLSRPARVGLGAVAGLGLGWSVWTVAHPAIGIDGVVYHLTEIVGWVHSGHPGAVDRITYEFPVGNYPLTNEVLLAWATGISRSFVPFALWTPAAVALLVVAGWSGLRALGTPRLAAGLALAAVCANPIVAIGLSGPDTDTAAVVWLVCAAALVARARDRPELLAFAILAAGLGVGTKTTVLPLTAVALTIGFVQCRADLRRLAIPLGLAAAGAVVVGGTWYLRNLIDHGSPLWPFASTPWGDPKPRFFASAGARLLDHPRATLLDRSGLYVATLAGGVALVLGAFAVTALERRRAVLAAAAATAAALLAWMNAPFTGVSSNSVVDFTLVTTRYLLSTFAVAALTLALAARSRVARARILAVGVLAGSVGWSVGRDLHVGDPFVPGIRWLGLGAAAGAVAALIIGRRAPRGPLLRVPVVAAVVGLALVPAANGFMRRHADTRATPDASIAQWLTAQRDYVNGHQPVALTPMVFGVLAGDRLNHRVELIGPRESCADVRARARVGWVIVHPVTLTPLQRYYFPDVPRALAAASCLASERPVYDDGTQRIYRLGAGRLPAAHG